MRKQINGALLLNPLPLNQKLSGEPSLSNTVLSKGRRFLVVLMGLSVVMLSTESAFARSCYQDEKGRIFKKGRPGYKVVDCDKASDRAYAQEVAKPEPVVEETVEATPVEKKEKPAAKAVVKKAEAKKVEVKKATVKKAEVKKAKVKKAKVAAKKPFVKPKKRKPRFRPGAKPRLREKKRIAAQKKAKASGVKLVAKKTPPKKLNNLSIPNLADYPVSTPVPDRWRIVEALGYEDNIFDPYHRNRYKGDRPLHDDWFFNLGIISDLVYETRQIPTPVGLSSTNRGNSIDVFGQEEQSLINHNLAMEFVYYKGDTVFRPPDIEYRFIPVMNFNRTVIDEVGFLNVDPEKGETRNDDHFGIQGAFVDFHLRNVSDRYDFDSIRIGIQPITADFRGFLFQDAPFGIRLFGNRDNNLFQYNIAWFRRLEKDTNSGLNDVGESPRDDDVFMFNVYWQDMPTLGFFSQATIVHNRNREDEDFLYDNNGIILRPASLGNERLRNYDVTYFGYNGDGHFGRLNLTVSAYYALGEEENGVFVNEEVDIKAGFFAFEASIDEDWIRPRLSFLYATGDDDPFDDVANGFDAIFENPIIAGADTSFWIRQAVPLVAGGKVALSGRNGVLNSMRSSKDEAQSNFTNPGMVLFGLGVDMDVTPELRVSYNANSLAFDDTTVLEVARNQGEISHRIGWDLSVALIYRPFMSQNIVMRASYARMLPDQGYKDLFGDQDTDSMLLNFILTY